MANKRPSYVSIQFYDTNFIFHDNLSIIPSSYDEIIIIKEKSEEKFIGMCQLEENNYIRQENFYNVRYDKWFDFKLQRTENQMNGEINLLDEEIIFQDTELPDANRIVDDMYYSLNMCSKKVIIYTYCNALLPHTITRKNSALKK